METNKDNNNEANQEDAIINDFGKKMESSRKEESSTASETCSSEFLDFALTLLKSSPAVTQDVTARCAELVKLQRIHENTQARNRLEKWTKSIIRWCLIFVAVLIVAYCIIRFFRATGILSDVILVTLLSTTTVTIIGLPLILLKGHFPDAKTEPVSGKSSTDVSGADDKINEHVN